MNWQDKLIRTGDQWFDKGYLIYVIIAVIIVGVLILMGSIYR